MTVNVTKQCEIFNCDKKHGNYCCYYCKEGCDNRCKNDPSCCGMFMKPQNYNRWYTQIIEQGRIEIKDGVTLGDCLRKLSEYEATKLQPQDIRAIQRQRGVKCD
ncbi:MAG: hypothetical protein U0O22_02415 [Acutalibacteraceae bacterium]